MTKGTIYCVLLALAMVVLFVLNLVKGSIDIPVGDVASILAGNAEGVKPSCFIC